jgi:hypothetical protein
LILLISTSWIARVISMNHQHLAHYLFLIVDCWLVVPKDNFQKMII